jgi:hypothetical protein
MTDASPRPPREPPNPQFRVPSGMRTPSLFFGLILLSACVSEEELIQDTELDEFYPSMSDEKCMAEVGDGLDSATPLACEFAIPEGAMVDPSKIRIVYTPDPDTMGINFDLVASEADCDGYGFYVANGIVYLCPAACDLVKNGGPKAELEIVLGCDEP